MGMYNARRIQQKVDFFESPRMTTGAARVGLKAGMRVIRAAPPQSVLYKETRILELGSACVSR